MCDTSRTRAATLRPRWNRLYAVLSIAFVAAAAVNASAPEPLAHSLLYGIAGAGWLAGVLWIRANRTAPQQSDWCACAAGSVTIRRVTSEPRPPAPPRQPDR